MKIKDYLLDIRIHIGIGLVAFAVMVIAYIESNAEKLSDMPTYGNIAMAVFLIVLIGNVSARLFMAWVLYPFITLFTRNRK